MEELKKGFFNKFYSRSFHDAKRKEFLKLIQGSSFVAEYEKTYIEVSTYAISMFEDENEDAKGLKN